MTSVEQMDEGSGIVSDSQSQQGQAQSQQDIAGPGQSANPRTGRFIGAPATTAELQAAAKTARGKGYRR